MISRRDPQSQSNLLDTAAWSTDCRPPLDIPDGPRCPTCGRAALPFDPQLSGVLDQVVLLEALVHDLRRAIEEVAS
jgi:hypothetical protein